MAGWFIVEPTTHDLSTICESPFLLRQRESGAHFDSYPRLSRRGEKDGGGEPFGPGFGRPQITGMTGSRTGGEMLQSSSSRALHRPGL